MGQNSLLLHWAQTKILTDRQLSFEKRFYGSDQKNRLIS
ncbi:hypothetical protein YEP4_05134 [Yersinia enterocolitica subsp. palearctica YE-P4]|nr:hypothetical protein IOK_19080 [Yersinia enterocolitica subsp. palearctica PhRBD_Ye1]EOR68821.1 hypothetical protein YE149_05169 [Yersinia enterocolitica subsp. palearctica YE-149]EOR79265.1 hypothetical protein YE150_05144 [Yersinia enterocolitica subsp. palearctica YE-150]EOR82912.1 hypothetical protein YEP4_05134 [Yersinia enterocolitica subsp. palearctica YE-P4]